MERQERERLKALAKPTVHLNGTSRASLVEGYLKASLALDRALGALGLTYPNGRDFYVQGEGALKRAQLEHDDRLTRVRSVLEEVRAIGEELALEERQH